MLNKLTNVIQTNKDRLHELKISAEEVKSSELNFKDEAEQVDLFSETAMARITLFKSNRLYIQILNIESGESIYFFDDFMDDGINIGEFIMEAIFKMKEGI